MTPPRGAKPREYRPITHFPIPPTWVSAPGATSFDSDVAEYVDTNTHLYRSSDPFSDVGSSEKVVVVGDMAVGKTSLVLRNCEDSFSVNYKATVGVDFMNSNYLVHNVRHTLHLWDTAGQERFRALSSAYYRGAGCAVICFDLTQPRTLDHCKSWWEQVRAENGGDDPLVFLVGLKLDLERVITPQLGESIARDMGAEYWECSAKDNENVTQLFDRIAVLTFERRVRQAFTAKRGRGASRSEQPVAIGTMGSREGRTAGTVILGSNGSNGGSGGGGGKKKKACCT